eukprot:12408278-Karenia_brevis.AAC.1
MQGKAEVPRAQARGATGRAQGFDNGSTAGALSLRHRQWLVLQGEVRLSTAYGYDALRLAP